MKCFPYLNYLFFLIVYIVLFIFMFNSKLENVIMIFLFIFSFIAGYNFIIDLKDGGYLMNFAPLQELFKDDGGMDIIKFMAFSPITTLFLFVLLIVVVVAYVSNKNQLYLDYIIGLSILLFVTNFIQVVLKATKFYLAWVFSIPVLMILLSILFVVITIYNINANNTNTMDAMPFSQLFSTSLIFKILLMLDIFIILLFMSYFVLFYKEGEKNIQFQLYAATGVVYAISGFMIYLSSAYLKKKFVNKAAG